MTAGRNYRTEIEAALAGGRRTHIPFTFYDGLLPAGVDVFDLRAKGMAICARRNVHRVVHDRVAIREVNEPDGSIATVYETPRGSLTARHRVGGYGARLPVERPIKTRDDYAVAEFIVADMGYQPAYEEFLSERERIGDSGITIAHSGYSPLLEIQIVWIGQQRLCYELADNYDAVMSLYEALARKHRELYQVVARGPSEYVLHCGNLVPEMLGVDLVRDCVFPCYNRFADELHGRGKKLGVHLDADNRLIMDLVQQSAIDFVEAFTPPPDCSVSVERARAAWPGKRLWINFPSSVHLTPDANIRTVTEEIVAQAGDGRGFLIGVTEDVPAGHLRRSVSTILSAVADDGA